MEPKRYLVKHFRNTQEMEDWMNEKKDYELQSFQLQGGDIVVVMRHVYAR